MKWIKPVVFLAGVLLTAIIVLMMLLLVPVIEDPSAKFIDRKGQLASVNETRRWEEGDSTYTELTLNSSSGLEVKLSVRSPLDIQAPRPLVIFLGGQRTGRDANQLVKDTHNVVVAALSYSFRAGSGTSTVELISRLPEIQQAIVDAPPSILLATDYLLTLPYINKDQVELVGVSLGAFLVGAAAANDARIKRTWFIHGSAEPKNVFGHLMKRELKFAPLRKSLAEYLSMLIAGHYLKAERWIGKISPRPVVLINPRNDEMLPQASVELLHQSVKEPAEHIWMEGQHIKPYRTDIIGELAHDVLSRIAEDAAKAQM